VVITASLFFFYAFIQMNFFNAINTQLSETFNLNAEQLGQLFSMYFYANALFLFPVGNLVDRYSTRKLLLMAIAVSTIGTFIFAMADVYWVAAAGRFLVGAGGAFCFLCSIRVASRWFPPQKMAFVTGVAVTLAMLGGLVAQTPFSALVSLLGDWRQALLIDGVLGIVILAAVFFLVEDRPPGSQAEAAEQNRQLEELGLWRCIKIAALNPQNWFGGLYTALINLPVFILGGLWGIRYLCDVHGLTAEQASYATTIFFIGVIIGSPLYGWISDNMQRRVLPMIVGAVLSLAVFLVMMYVPNLSLTTLVALFFLIGLVTSSQVLTYPTIAELNPAYLTSTAISIDSICIMISGFVFPPFFGWFIDRSGAHQVVNGVTVYSPQAFDLAMLIMPIGFVAALIIAFFMRETNCRSQA
jgi:MFS family permease